MINLILATYITCYHPIILKEVHPNDWQYVENPDKTKYEWPSCGLDDKPVKS